MLKNFKDIINDSVFESEKDCLASLETELPTVKTDDNLYIRCVSLKNNLHSAVSKILEHKYKYIEKENQYDLALGIKDSDLEEAYKIFSSLEGYKNSKKECEKLQKSINEETYNFAKEVLEQQKYSKAVELFEEIIDYKDSKILLAKAKDEIAKIEYKEIHKQDEIDYQKALILKDTNKRKAYDIFSRLKDYKNSEEEAKLILDELNEITYLKATEALKSNDFETAKRLFSEILTYKDSKNLRAEACKKEEFERETKEKKERRKNLILNCFFGITLLLAILSLVSLIVLRVDSNLYHIYLEACHLKNGIDAIYIAFLVTYSVGLLALLIIFIKSMHKRIWSIVITGIITIFGICYSGYVGPKVSESMNFTYADQVEITINNKNKKDNYDSCLVYFDIKNNAKFDITWIVFETEFLLDGERILLANGRFSDDLTYNPKIYTSETFKRGKKETISAYFISKKFAEASLDKLECYCKIVEMQSYEHNFNGIEKRVKIL